MNTVSDRKSARKHLPVPLYALERGMLLIQVGVVFFEPTCIAETSRANERNIETSEQR